MINIMIAFVIIHLLNTVLSQEKGVNEENVSGIRDFHPELVSYCV